MKNLLVLVLVIAACGVDATPSSTTSENLCIEGDVDCGAPGSNPSATTLATSSVQSYSSDYHDSPGCSGTATNATCWISIGLYEYTCNVYTDGVSFCDENGQNCQLDWTYNCWTSQLPF